MNAFAEFHFLRPWYLLALALLPLAWFAWRHVRSEAGAWRTMVDAHLLPFLLERSGERVRNGGAWLAAAVWTLACIALAGPAWEREALPLYRNDAARVLAIELAPTMLAADIKPSRLERARYKVNDILQASRDMQTALIGYSGDAFVAAPLTDDVNTVRNLVDALDPAVMPVAGNATERAIDQAWRLIEQAGLKRGELVLLADSVSDQAIAAARDANAKGLTISVLGIGSASGAPVPLPQGGFLQDAAGNIVLPRLDESGLRALANAGGGRYAGLSADRSDIDSLLSIDRAEAAAALADGGRAVSDRFRDRGPWFVLLLLPLALLAFRRGWLMVFALALLAPIPEAQAFSFTDLWLRPDQQAAKALADGDTARAQELARDPALRGGAAYRAGDFPAANEAYEQAIGADADYNKGNTLTKLGKYEEAMSAYERALAADPQMEDAKANKQAVEEWLKREQSKDDQKQQGDKKDQQQDDKGDPSQGEPSEQEKSDQQKDQQRSDQQKDDKGEPKDKDAEQKEGKQDDAADQKPQNNEEAKSAEQKAQEEQQRAQQQQDLSKAIDQALDKKDGKEEQLPAATPEEEAAREQQQALNQWLQRVPDDPGGLLRRKFQLEYERRKRGGGGG
jgi:Ca-activated chloride channel family protein